MYQWNLLLQYWLCWKKVPIWLVTYSYFNHSYHQGKVQTTALIRCRSTLASILISYFKPCFYRANIPKRCSFHWWERWCWLSEHRSGSYENWFYRLDHLELLNSEVTCKQSNCYPFLLNSDSSQYTFCDISGGTLPKDVIDPLVTVENDHVGACLFTSTQGTESYSCLVSPLPRRGSPNPSLIWTETFLPQSSGEGTDTAIPNTCKYILVCHNANLKLMFLVL